MLPHLFEQEAALELFFAQSAHRLCMTRVACWQEAREQGGEDQNGNHDCESQGVIRSDAGDEVLQHECGGETPQ